jgi:hypothetical protein
MDVPPPDAYFERQEQAHHFYQLGRKLLHQKQFVTIDTERRPMIFLLQ